MTPSELAIAAKSYSYDLDTWKKIVAYLLAVDAGLQGDTPKQLADAAKCFCFPDLSTWKSVVAYLLSAGGGGGNVQDMQVAWTPTNLKLGQEMGFVADPTFGSQPSLAGITSLTLQQTTTSGFFDIEKASDLLTISAPNLTSISGASASNYFAVQLNPVLTSVDFPVLTTTSFVNLLINGNPNLVTINIPNYLPTAGLGIDFHNNALNAASVNMLLARCVAVPTYGNAAEVIFLNGGTNAAPSGQGIADKATLIGRGATVNTN